MTDYDLIIIGAGPGGYVAAIKAAQLGKKVAIVEKEDLGGICCNWGCIPTKALLKNSEVLSYIKNASKYGIDIDNYSINWTKVIKRSRDVVKRLNKGIEYLIKKNNIDYIQGVAKIISSNKIPFILHHMQGTPQTMQKNPKYVDALLDIYDFFEEKINFCEKKNYSKNLIIVDPGIGFGKNINHNLRIMSKISIFHSLGCPILIGTSRKRFIEHIVTKFDTQDRTGGTLASVLYGLSLGVQLFRVHNVKEIYQGILVFNKILNTN